MKKLMIHVFENINLMTPNSAPVEFGVWGLMPIHSWHAHPQPAVQAAPQIIKGNSTTWDQPRHFDLLGLHMPCTNLASRYLVPSSHKTNGKKADYTLKLKPIIWASEATMLTIICHQTSSKPSAVPICVGEYASGICGTWAIITNHLGHNTNTTELHQASTQLIATNLTAPDKLPKET